VGNYPFSIDRATTDNPSAVPANLNNQTSTNKLVDLAFILVFLRKILKKEAILFIEYFSKEELGLEG